MPLEAVSNKPERTHALNVFCSPYKGSWRVHLNPNWAPRYLLHCFDENYEAYPVEIDLDDLDRYMKYHEAMLGEDRAALHAGLV